MSSRIHQRLKRTPGFYRQLWYMPILVAAMALMMVRLMVLARLLSIEEFGYFSIGILVSSTFSMVGSFGLKNMLQRDSPGLFLREKERQVALLTIQSCLVALATFVIGLLVVGVSVQLLAIQGTFFTLGLFHGLAQQLFLIATLESRSRGEVLRYATQNLLRSAAIFFVSFAIAYCDKSAAPLLVVEATITIIFSLYFFKTGIFDQTAISTLVHSAYSKLPGVNWAVALTLLGSSMYGILASNGDRWIASSVLDISEFAQYSFAWIILAIAQSAQAVINAAIFPFVSVRYAARGANAAFTACAAVAGGIGLLLFVLSVPAYFLMSSAINLWYPDYVGVIPLLPVFLFISIVRISDFWSTFMLVCGLEKKLVYFSSLSLLLFILLAAVAYSTGFLAQMDSLKVAYLALAINLIFVGTTAVVSFFNRTAAH